MASDEHWVSRRVNSWFAREARELPWREDHATPWAVLVSEFMLQQTQVDRVLPRFTEWMERWPHPADLAAEEPGEAVRAWGRLGYPRRALWLHRAATEITNRYDGEVPRDVERLLDLTGVGPYTARAVASFAYGERHPVVDTNTRRVLARFVHGRAAAGMPSRHDLTDMETLLPDDAAEAETFNAAMMELGAVVCVARKPRCADCPIAARCEWRGAGYPDNAPSRRPKQARFEGSHRQMRGRILALLRSTSEPLERSSLLESAAEGSDDPSLPGRAYDSLAADGLLVEFEGRARLP